MELKNVRFISLVILAGFLFVRIFHGPLVPENLKIETEDKIYLIQAGEPWGLYFKHATTYHPYLDPDAITSLRLESDDIGVELSIETLTSHESLGVFGITFLSVSHPFASIETPLFFVEPQLIFSMIDGSQLVFKLSYVGFFPEREQRSNLQFTEIYGLYQTLKPGLHGLYLSLNNPTSEAICMTHINIGLKEDISLKDIHQTESEFIPHQAFEEYQKKAFDGCIKPFTSIRLLIHQPLDVVLETVVISIHLKGQDAYLNPIRLVRNIPFHHQIKTIDGNYHD